MRIEANGRKVTIVNGPAKTVRRFRTEDEALDFAVAAEDEQLETVKRWLTSLAAHAADDHPSAPILPDPEVLRRAVASVHNHDHPDGPALTPDDFLSSPTGSPADDSLAILSAFRASLCGHEKADGGQVTVDPEAPQDPEETEAPEAPEETEGGQVVADPGAPADPEAPEAPEDDVPAVEAEFVYSEERERVEVSFVSTASTQMNLERAVIADDGEIVRSGEVELPAGEELRRHYGLKPGQTIRFTAAGYLIGEHTA